MKRLALVAAVLSIAACTAREEAPVDTAATPPAVAPAPAATDTGMKMDTMTKDTTMKKDTPTSK